MGEFGDQNMEPLSDGDWSGESLMDGGDPAASCDMDVARALCAMVISLTMPLHSSCTGKSCGNLTTQLEPGLRRSPEPSRQVDNKQNQKQSKHSQHGSKTPQLKQETDQRGCTPFTTHTHTEMT